MSEAFDTIERLIACSHGDEGRMFLCGKRPGVMDFGAAVDLAFFFQPSFEVFLAKHDIRFRVGAQLPSLARAYDVFASLAFGYGRWSQRWACGSHEDDNHEISVVVKGSGYPERAASEELLQSTHARFPPAYIEDTGKEELRSDDVDVVNVGTGLDFATAKLCV